MRLSYTSYQLVQAQHQTFSLAQPVMAEQDGGYIIENHHATQLQISGDIIKYGKPAKHVVDGVGYRQISTLLSRMFILISDKMA